MNAKEIMANIVRHHFPPRRYAVCPNVSWGLLPWEADLVCVTPAGKVHEIEIKISAGDLARDSKKRKWNGAFTPYHYVDAYWLAVPKELEEQARARAQGLGAGLFVVSENFSTKALTPKWKRIPHPTPDYHPMANAKATVWRLCALRYWDQILTP